jgi:hypothetical protein
MVTNEESELLSAYLDRELRGEKLATVRDRLSASAEWREELEKLKRSKAFMAELPTMPAPADLLETLGRAAEQRMKEKYSLWESLQAAFAWNPWLASGSALATLAFGVVLYMHRAVAPSLPLEPLLAAHAQAQQSSLLPQQLKAASEYSAEVRSHVTS